MGLCLGNGWGVRGWIQLPLLATSTVGWYNQSVAVAVVSVPHLPLLDTWALSTLRLP